MAVVTQQGLDALKKYFVGDAVIQSLTLEHVTANVRDLPEPDLERHTMRMYENYVPHPDITDTWSDCDYAIAKVVFAGVGAFLGMSTLSARILTWSKLPNKMVSVLNSQYGSIGQTIRLIPTNAGIMKVAEKYLAVVVYLNTVNVLGHIIYGLLEELSWWEWLLLAVQAALLFASFFAPGFGQVAALYAAIVNLTMFILAIENVTNKCSAKAGGDLIGATA